MTTVTLTNVLTAGIMTVATIGATPLATDNPNKLSNGYVTYEMVDTDTKGTLAEDASTPAYWTTLWYDASEISNANALSVNSFTTIETKPVVEPVKEVKAQVPTPTMMPIPTVTKAPVQAVTASTQGTLSDAQITALGNCEAGMDPAKNTGNGYYGAFQFSQGTWNSMNTGYARADLAPIEVQKAAVQQLLAKSSIYNQFPGCAGKMRNQGII